MQTEAIKLLGKVEFDRGAGETPGRHVVVLNLEVAGFGYALGPDLIAALRELDGPGFQRVRDELLGQLEALSGMTVNHRHLFAGFPYETPDGFDYLVKRVAGFLQNDLRLTDISFTALSCGHLVDPRLFELKAFGACPICQFGVAELTSPPGERYPFEAVTPLKVLGYLTAQERIGFAQRLLDRQSSLSADEKAFLGATIRAGHQLAVPEVVFRESLPFVYEMSGAPGVRPHIAGATDVLRIAAWLSDPNADLSLKEPVRFKLATRHKKALLGLLETTRNLEEDMLRRRERWLRFGEIVNPGSAENTRKYPTVAAAFDTLRNAPGSVPTFQRHVEQAIRARAVAAPLLKLLASRPGEFARKLDFLLREADDPVAVANAFASVAPELKTRTLIELDKYLSSRASHRTRVFLPKGAVNKAQVVEDRRKALPQDQVRAVRALIGSTLQQRLCQLPNLGRVWIDPRLKDRAVPLNRRGDGSTAMPMAKGSRYPFDGEVVRLFVHWRGRVDVDLSVTLFDEALEWKGHVAFTNLQLPGCVHSGDIQDAPEGASEFIDLEVATLLTQGVRYVGTSLISFRGQGFNDFPCFAGFMERDALASGATYEPQSVKFKFDVDAPTTSHMPLIFDLKDQMVTFVDMASANRAGGAVAGERSKQAVLLESMLSMLERKPTLHDLAMAHALARGTPADSPVRADTIFDLDWADGPGADGLLD
jgi:hypothetical protein